MVVLQFFYLFLAFDKVEHNCGKNQLVLTKFCYSVYISVLYFGVRSISGKFSDAYQSLSEIH